MKLLTNSRVISKYRAAHLLDLDINFWGLSSCWNL